MGLCRSREQLHSLLVGGPDGPEREALEDHLRACPVCQEALGALAGERTGTRQQTSPSSIQPQAGFRWRLEEKNPPSATQGAPRGPDHCGGEAAGVHDRAAIANEGIGSAAGHRRYPVITGFEVVREIGHGGMGIVYEAIDRALGRRVALKVILPQVAGSALAVARFRREAQAAARLHHTNIVPVFGGGEEEDQLYYVMQFIEGEGLDQLFRRLSRGRPDVIESASPTDVTRSAGAARPPPGPTPCAGAGAPLPLTGSMRSQPSPTLGKNFRPTRSMRTTPWAFPSPMRSIQDPLSRFWGP